MKNFIAITTVILFLISHGIGQDDQKESTKDTGLKKERVFLKDGKSSSVDEETVLEIGLLIEFIETNHDAANRLLRMVASTPNDVEQLRDELEAMLDEETAELIETTWVRAISGSRAKTESIREYIYPTDADPPEIPNHIGNSALPADIDSKYPEGFLTSSTPTAFETRSVGTMLEIDPAIQPNPHSPDPYLIYINLAPEITTRLDDRYYLRPGFEDSARGIEHVSSPTFYIYKDVTTVEAAPGKYTLLGIHTPHHSPDRKVFCILRADLIPIN